MPRIFVIATLLLSACAAADDGEDVFATGALTSATGASTTASSDTSGAEGTGGGSVTGEGTGVLFDVGDGMETAGGDDGGQTMGCRGIDFLFVIDNSGSMLDEQLNLVSSFPGFIDAIESTLTNEQARDFHVMVVDTDNGQSFDPPVTTGCGAEIGAGLVMDTSHYDCGVPQGRRYMTSDDPTMAGAFGCLAYLGTGGAAGERPMAAATRAVGELGGAGGCNEGFLRDDAILVVTIITDEDDDDSLGSPETWVQSILQAKGGDLGGVVMVGLVSDAGEPAALCEAGDAQLAPKINTFLDGFGSQALRGSVCAPDYAPFLLEAVSTIATTCQDYVPPQG